MLKATNLITGGPDDRTLFFESRFESGNLRRAVQAYEFEYFALHEFLLMFVPPTTIALYPELFFDN